MRRTIKKEIKAPQAASKIHSDFERGFIKAEVINYQEFLDCQTYTAAKEKGLVRMEGKDYVVQDASRVEFAILTILEVEGRDYIALLPIDEEEEGRVYLYRYLESPEGEPSLDNILDDEEYDKAADAFSEWLDAQEYDGSVDEEDLED